MPLYRLWLQIEVQDDDGEHGEHFDTFSLDKHDVPVKDSRDLQVVLDYQCDHALPHWRDEIPCVEVLQPIVDKLIAEAVAKYKESEG